MQHRQAGPTTVDTAAPITVLVCALGGEGGGVLSQWLFEVALACGHAAQGTSIPGVAQRTGSTTYYVEVDRRPGRATDPPVFSLSPVPGAIDLLVSSELLETARQVSAGMVNPERTRVVSSTSRTLTVQEKMQPTDGRIDAAPLVALVRRHAREAVLLDMARLAEEARTVPSAVMLGCIAASGVLPFPPQAYEEVIRSSGKGVEASVRGFRLALERVRALREAGRWVDEALETPGLGVGPEPARAAAPPSLNAQWLARFPATLHELLGLAVDRLRQYQDEAYAQLYLERVARIHAAELAADPAGTRSHELTREAARYLAAWMSFDDIIRVADLKSRWSRLQRIRHEAKAGPDDVVHVLDHFKPGIPELAALLPRSLGRRLERWDARRIARGAEPWGRPIVVRAHTLTGALALRLLAGLRRWRRLGTRYQTEQAHIERWLAALEEGTRADWTLGREIAECARLIKGYGATHARGEGRLLHLLDHVVARGDLGPAARADAVRAARQAAQADDTGHALDTVLHRWGAPPAPVREQPIRWYRRRPGSA